MAPPEAEGGRNPQGHREARRRSSGGTAEMTRQKQEPRSRPYGKRQHPGHALR